jgi:hypothetical protein
MDKVDLYTASDVRRTAFSYVDTPPSNYSLGAGLKHGINQVCISCKAGTQAWEVERITDAVDLKPWADFYKTKDYAAYKCGCCGYQWSWYRDATKEST